MQHIESLDKGVEEVIEKVKKELRVNKYKLKDKDVQRIIYSKWESNKTILG